MSRRVVLTGMGVISAAGPGLDAFSLAVRKGTCCLSAVSDPRVSHLRARLAGAALDFDAAAALAAAGAPAAFDRFAALALVAAREALTHGRLLPVPPALRCAIVLGTCSGPMPLIERMYGRALAGDCSLSDEEYAASRYWSAGRMLAYVFGIGGPNLTVTTACSASTVAIGMACDLIASGMVDAALAGGADALSLSTLAGFDALKATCEGRCAPFSRPPGMNLGEAAAFALLEDSVCAQRRGAAALAEVLGYGSSNDAYHPTAPEPSGRGPAAAMRRALADACLSPAAISYVNAHGTGTEANDKAETRAARAVFGSAAPSVPMSSIKGVTGHCLGAAGMLEAIAGVVCRQAGLLPPTANYAGPREGCDLDYVPQVGRRWIGTGPFMSNNLAFGGNNASVIVGRCDAASERPETAAVADVYISAAGVVCGAGIGRERMIEGLDRLGGEGATAPLVDESLLRPLERRLDVRGMDRASRFAVSAAWLALEEAGIAGRPPDRADYGLYLGCAHAPLWAEAEHISALLRDGFRMDRLSAFPYIVPNSVNGNVCRALGLAGPNATLCLGEGCGLTTLGLAFRALQQRRCEVLLAGCADQQAAGPLGAALSLRGGGEAGVVLALESAAHLSDRGGSALGHIVAFAASADTTHAFLADHAATRLAATARAALAEAGIGGHDVSVVCCDSETAAEALEWLVPSWREKVCEAAALTGRPECSAGLLALCRLLGRTGFRATDRGKYILCLTATPFGLNTALVVACGDHAARE